MAVPAFVVLPLPEVVALLLGPCYLFLHVYLIFFENFFFSELQGKGSVGGWTTILGQKLHKD